MRWVRWLVRPVVEVEWAVGEVERAMGEVEGAVDEVGEDGG